MLHLFLVHVQIREIEWIRSSELFAHSWRWQIIQQTISVYRLFELPSDLQGSCISCCTFPNFLPEVLPKQLHVYMGDCWSLPSLLCIRDHWLDNGCFAWRHGCRPNSCAEEKLGAVQCSIGFRPPTLRRSRILPSQNWLASVLAAYESNASYGINGETVRASLLGRCLAVSWGGRLAPMTPS
jgi:hypothetical protein